MFTFGLTIFSILGLGISGGDGNSGGLDMGNVVFLATGAVAAVRILGRVVGCTRFGVGILMTEDRDAFAACASSIWSAFRSVDLGRRSRTSLAESSLEYFRRRINDSQVDS